MIKQVLIRFGQREGFDSAAILSFNTLFALVPALTLGLSVFSLSPYFSRLQQHLEQFLFTQLLPQNYDVAKDYIADFVTQAQSITGISVGFLIFAVMLLLYEIDKRINLVWHEKHHRHWMEGLISYAFVLFLGPILLGASLFASSYIAASELLSGLTVWSNVSQYLPWVLSSVGLAMIYYFVPVEMVRFSNALKAGVLVAVLLELLKYAVFLYIQYFPIYELIYGALSAAILLMLWVYLAWMVVLLGASFCYCLENKSAI